MKIHMEVDRDCSSDGDFCWLHPESACEACSTDERTAGCSARRHPVRTVSTTSAVTSVRAPDISKMVTERGA